MYVLIEPLYQLQYGSTPLHHAVNGGHTACVEHLLSTPGIDVNTKDEVSLHMLCTYIVQLLMITGIVHVHVYM